MALTGPLTPKLEQLIVWEFGVTSL